VDLIKNMNVRAHFDAAAARIQRGLGAWLRPQRTAEQLAAQFLAAPPRRRISDTERALFATAERLSLRFDGETLVVYRFSEPRDRAGSIDDTRASPEVTADRPHPDGASARQPSAGASAANLRPSGEAAEPRAGAVATAGRALASASTEPAQPTGETTEVRRRAGGAQMLAERLRPDARPRRKPAVLLLHGQGGNAQQLHAFVPPLLAAGFEVLALDAPGHGASSGDWLAIPRYGQAIDAAARELGPFHAVIAHSLGAPAATFAMMLGMQVERAVFVGPPADAFVYFVRWARHLALPAKLVGLTKRAAERRAGYELERINAERLGSSVKAPLLVIHDRDDREIPHRDGERVARASSGGRLITTAGLGHRRILQDAAVIGAALDFIAGAEQHARVA
jgi:pimeloyl-ACP methyl ester carboxylesterase